MSHCNNDSCAAGIIKFSSIGMDVSANDSCVARMIKLPSIGKDISVQFLKNLHLSRISVSVPLVDARLLLALLPASADPDKLISLKW